MTTASLLLVVGTLGCGSTASKPSTSASQPPQPYFAPNVSNTTNNGSLLQQVSLYALDDVANPKTFTQSIFGLPRGSQLINAGTMTQSSRGLLTLEVTANYVPTGIGGAYVPNITPKSGSFAVELAGKAGAIIQVVGEPPAVAVEALACPVSTSPQTYLFLTIPAGQIDSATPGTNPPFWDPAKNTGYGSVDISSDGTNVSFANIRQFTVPLPSGGGNTAPANPSAVSKTGVCGPSALGQTISLPGQNVTTDPGSSTVVALGQATIGIGPSGLLVEDNGLIRRTAGEYENALGDGTGAIGLPKSLSPVDIAALRSVQYLGFVYNAGTYVLGGGVSSGWSSHITSFGFQTVPSACSSVAAGTSTVLYGGDFPQDDPSQSADGFGNCNLAIDFGTQDGTTNGLFPHATVTLGGLYAANSKKATYSFPAIAIAGQLNGKFAVFLLGTDNTQPWMIELFQSN